MSTTDPKKHPPQIKYIIGNEGGNLITAGISALNVFTGAGQYLFYAVLIFLAAIGFALLAKRYVAVDFFQKTAAAPSAPVAGPTTSARSLAERLRSSEPRRATSSTTFDALLRHISRCSPSNPSSSFAREPPLEARDATLISGDCEAWHPTSLKEVGRYRVDHRSHLGEVEQS